MTVFERIAENALPAARDVPCERIAYIEGLETIVEAVEQELAAARELAEEED